MFGFLLCFPLRTTRGTRRACQREGLFWIFQEAFFLSSARALMFRVHEFAPLLSGTGHVEKAAATAAAAAFVCLRRTFPAFVC